MMIGETLHTRSLKPQANNVPCMLAGVHLLKVVVEHGTPSEDRAFSWMMLKKTLK